MPRQKSPYGPGQNPASRANLTKFKPGASGNPAGRPPNGPLITPAMRRFAGMTSYQLLNMPQKEMDRLTAAELIALRYICEAMSTGFERSSAEVIERLDGKVKDVTAIEASGEVNLILTWADGSEA